MLYLDTTPSPFLCCCLPLPHLRVATDSVLLAAGITTSLFLQDSKFSFSQEDNWIVCKNFIKTSLYWHKDTENPSISELLGAFTGCFGRNVIECRGISTFLCHSMTFFLTYNFILTYLPIIMSFKGYEFHSRSVVVLA